MNTKVYVKIGLAASKITHEYWRIGFWSNFKIGFMKLGEVISTKFSALMQLINSNKFHFEQCENLCCGCCVQSRYSFLKFEVLIWKKGCVTNCSNTAAVALCSQFHRGAVNSTLGTIPYISKNQISDNSLNNFLNEQYLQTRKK